VPSEERLPVAGREHHVARQPERGDLSLLRAEPADVGPELLGELDIQTQFVNSPSEPIPNGRSGKVSRLNKADTAPTAAASVQGLTRALVNAASPAATAWV
jgi:hypothetical protein